MVLTTLLSMEFRLTFQISSAEFEAQFKTVPIQNMKPYIIMYKLQVCQDWANPAQSKPLIVIQGEARLFTSRIFCEFCMTDGCDPNEPEPQQAESSTYLTAQNLQQNLMIITFRLFLMNYLILTTPTWIRSITVKFWWNTGVCYKSRVMSRCDSNKMINSMHCSQSFPQIMH